MYYGLGKWIFSSIHVYFTQLKVSKCINSEHSIKHYKLRQTKDYNVMSFNQQKTSKHIPIQVLMNIHVLHHLLLSIKQTLYTIRLLSCMPLPTKQAVMHTMDGEGPWGLGCSCLIHRQTAVHPSVWQCHVIDDKSIHCLSNPRAQGN